MLFRSGEPGVGTMVRARQGRLPARKVWIAFAVGAAGRISVDAGARAALLTGGSSLLPAGVVSADGGFDEGDAVEVADADGAVFAKGISRISASDLLLVAGLRSSQVPADVSPVAIHRDDLVVLPEG